MGDLDRVGVVILAAGSSRRLGRSKQLLVLDGKPLLQHAVDLAADSGARETVLVLGHDADRIATALALPHGVTVAVNPDHASGQGSSLSVGIQTLSGGIDRAVVLLGDQPRVEADVLRAVAEGPGPVRRAHYRGTPGHPVAFDRALWGSLLAIDGDRGARAILADHPEWIQDVDIDADPPGDVDTQDDVEAIGASG